MQICLVWLIVLFWFTSVFKAFDVNNYLKNTNEDIIDKYKPMSEMSTKMQNRSFSAIITDNSYSAVFTSLGDCTCVCVVGLLREWLFRESTLKWNSSAYEKYEYGHLDSLVYQIKSLYEVLKLKLIF